MPRSNAGCPITTMPPSICDSSGIGSHPPCNQYLKSQCPDAQFRQITSCALLVVALRAADLARIVRRRQRLVRLLDDDEPQPANPIRHHIKRCRFPSLTSAAGIRTAPFSIRHLLRRRKRRILPRINEFRRNQQNERQKPRTKLPSRGVPAAPSTFAFRCAAPSSSPALRAAPRAPFEQIIAAASAST